MQAVARMMLTAALLLAAGAADAQTITGTITGTAR